MSSRCGRQISTNEIVVEVDFDLFDAHGHVVSCQFVVDLCEVVSCEISM